MTGLERALKNTLALSAADIFGKALNFVLMAILARQLTPDDFGGYTTVLSLVWFLVPLSDLGLSQVLTRETAAERERAGLLLFNGLIVSGLLGLGGGLLLCAIAFLGRYPDALRAWIALASLAVVSGTLTQTGYAVLRGLERMELQALASSLTLIVASLGGLTLAWQGFGVGAQVMFFSSAMILGAAFTLGILVRGQVRWQKQVDFTLCKQLLRMALPISVLIAYSVALRWSDILILGQTRGMADVATYGTAQKVIDLISVISASASTALLPLLAQRWRISGQKTHTLFLRALRFFTDFGVGAAAGLSMLAEPIITMLFGGRYAQAGASLRILAFAFLFQVVSGPTGTLLIATGEKMRRFVPVIGTVVGLNVLLNLLLTPRWGYMGASWAFLGTSVAVFGVRQWIAAEHFKHAPRMFALLWRPGLAAAGMGGALWVVQPGNLWFAIGLGATAYLLVLSIVGEFQQAPYPELWHWLQERVQYAWPKSA